MENKKTNVFFKIIHIISYIFLLVLFLIAGFLVFYITSSAIAKAQGKRPPISLYTIASPSMEPTIMVYDVIVNANVKSDEELVDNPKGTIITFYSDVLDTGGYTVTHRIYKKYLYNGIAYYETKGDNNKSPDSGRITLKNVVGRYLFKIPQLGRIQFFVTSKIGWILIVVIPAILIIGLDVFKLRKAYNIKNDLNQIDDNPNVTKYEEQERDKEVRAILEKSDKINKK